MPSKYAYACIVLLGLTSLTLLVGAISYSRFDLVTLNAEINDHRFECDAPENKRNYDIQKECHSFLFRLWSDPVALFTAGLFAATIALFGATFLLYVAAVLQGIDTKDGLRLTREASIQQLRAFIFVKTIDSSSHIEPDTGRIWWSFEVVWENSGNTPTKSLYIHAYRYLSEERMPGDFKFEGNFPRTIRSLLGPKSSAQSDAIVVYGDDLARVIKKELHFYIWGYAEYQDVFSETKMHITRFCYKVLVLGDPTKTPSGENMVEFKFAHHPRFNCADEGCAEQDRNPIRRTI